MICRPTTEQLLLDCATELRQGVLPYVADPTVTIRIHMLEQVLRSAAVRCANEIAWMLAEIPAIENYGRAVQEAAADAELADLLGALDQADDEDLTLDAVVARYYKAGQVLSTALEIAVLTGLDGLRPQGELILQDRLQREKDVMAGWSAPTGR